MFFYLAAIYSRVALPISKSVHDLRQIDNGVYAPHPLYNDKLLWMSSGSHVGLLEGCSGEIFALNSTITRLPFSHAHDPYCTFYRINLWCIRSETWSSSLVVIEWILQMPFFLPAPPRPPPSVLWPRAARRMSFPSLLRYRYYCVLSFCPSFPWWHFYTYHWYLLVGIISVLPTYQ